MIHGFLRGQGSRTPALMFCLIVGALGVFWQGCRQKPSQEVNKPQVAQPDAAASEANQVAVTVDGVSVTNGQVDSIVEDLFRPFADRASQWPPEFVAQRKKEARHNAIEKIVIETLLDEQIKQLGITVPDEELQQRISDLASKQEPPMSGEEFLGKVQASGMAVDTFRKELRLGVSRSKLLERQWTGKTEVTDEEAKAYYEKNLTDFDSPEMVKASHILISTEVNVPGTDPNQVKAAAKAKAEGLLAKIRAGADFAELAKANSACPSAAQGGELPYFKRGDMVAPFEKAAFALTPGQVSDVVETQFGFHIIKVTEHKAAGRSSFEEAKSSIVEQLTTEKKNQICRDYVESLKSKAKIEYGSK
jgi:peptidyl-prolyl cis-trans isomerase C